MVTRRDEEAGLEFTVSPETGGELASFRVRWKDRWVELLHKAPGSKIPIRGEWRGRAPWLFPAVGRNYTEEQLRRMAVSGAEERLGSWEHEGKVLGMPIHGFVMNRAWEALDEGETEAACLLAGDGDSRAFYPFDFELTARYGFLSKGIWARLEVLAAPSNAGPMPFSVGNHITLALPFGSRTPPGECRLFTPAREAWDLTKAGLLSGGRRPASLAAPMPLGRKSPLLNAVLGGFTPEQCWVEVSDPESFSVRVSQRELDSTAVQYTDPARYLFVLWGDTDLGFFCPEPWYGGPNSLNERRGVVSLPPGARFAWELRAELAW